MKNSTLLTWLKGMNENEARQKVGASFSYLRLIAYGHKRPSAKVATAIEMASHGQITRQELRPDDWREIWPELAAASA